MMSFPLTSVWSGNFSPPAAVNVLSLPFSKTESELSTVGFGVPALLSSSLSSITNAASNTAGSAVPDPSEGASLAAAFAPGLFPKSSLRDAVDVDRDRFA